MFSKVHADSLNSKPEDTSAIITEWLFKSQCDINIAAFTNKLLISLQLSLLAQQSMFPTIPYWLAFLTLPFLNLLPAPLHLHSKYRHNIRFLLVLKKSSSVPRHSKSTLNAWTAPWPPLLKLLDAGCQDSMLLKLSTLAFWKRNNFSSITVLYDYILWLFIKYRTEMFLEHLSFFCSVIKYSTTST